MMTPEDRYALRGVPDATRGSLGMVPGRTPEETPRLDLFADAGQGLSRDLCLLVTPDGNPIDLTGWSFRAHVRRSPGSGRLLLDCDPLNGRLVVDVAAGLVSISLAVDDVDALGAGEFSWDLLASTPDRPDPIFPVGGTLHVSVRTTRPTRPPDHADPYA